MRTTLAAFVLLLAVLAAQVDAAKPPPPKKKSPPPNGRNTLAKSPPPKKFPPPIAKKPPPQAMSPSPPSAVVYPVTIATSIDPSFVSLSALTVSGDGTTAFGWTPSSADASLYTASLVTITSTDATITTSFQNANFSNIGYLCALNRNGKMLYTSSSNGVAAYNLTSIVNNGGKFNAYSKQYPQYVSPPDGVFSSSPAMLFFTPSWAFWVAVYAQDDGSDMQVQIYNATNNVKFADVMLTGIETLDQSRPIILAVSGGGRRIAGKASYGQGVQLMTLDTAGNVFGNQVTLPLSGNVYNLAFSPDGQSLAVVLDNTIQVINCNAATTDPTNLGSYITFSQPILSAAPPFYFPGQKAPAASPPPAVVDPNAPTAGAKVGTLFMTANTVSYFNAYAATGYQALSYNVTSGIRIPWSSGIPMQAGQPQFNYGGVSGGSTLLVDTGVSTSVYRIA